MTGTPPETAQGTRLLTELAEIVGRLDDAKLLARFHPAGEPRQRGDDVRGGVRYLRDASRRFGSLNNRLLAAEAMARMAPRRRAVLVHWAEILEEAGEIRAAAAAARVALTLFYDDVYTQTLFLRCGGGKNFHESARDRFCSNPFENFEIYDDGSVYPCNCTQVPVPIGNVFFQGLQEIWNSPAAQAVRRSILDGTFKYCSPMTCWKRFDLPKRSAEPERFAELVRMGVRGAPVPRNLNLSYDRSCNLSCPSCRGDVFMADGGLRSRFSVVAQDIVLPILGSHEARSVYITGSGDAFGSPHYRGLLKELCKPEYSHIDITLGTNGQLITERLWSEFEPLHPRIGDITVSIDGARPETYERIRRGSTWEKLLLSMGVLCNARRENRIRRLMVNMVVQTDNFREMKDLLCLCKDWLVDGVRFYRIRQWGHTPASAYMESDIANPLHPLHGELLQEFRHPIFGDRIVDRYDMYELISRERAVTGS
jgi:radical SAM protein with 4Fe4S-binding SPASM domain